MIKSKQPQYSKEDSQFTHPLPEGFMRPYIFPLSEMFDGRWPYWLRTIDAGRPLDEPIPWIEFDESPHPEAMKNITDCLKIHEQQGHRRYEAWRDWVDWLAWGLGVTKYQDGFPNRVTEDVSWEWYQLYNHGLLMKYPADYMAWGSCELAGMSGGGNGYFPTPMGVCKLMARMTMEGCDKWETVSDCCVGSGSLLLVASNYSLRLKGQDISHHMCQLVMINAWTYIPWLAFPANGLIKWPERSTGEQPAVHLPLIPAHAPAPITTAHQLPLFEL